MARWRVLEPTLVALLVVSLAMTAARPIISTNLGPSTVAALLQDTVLIQERQSLTSRLSQNGQPDTSKANADHGGFSVASSVGVAVSATFTFAVIISLSYSAYYRHAKLKLRRQFLERLGPLAAPDRAQDQQTEASPETAIPDMLRRTGTAANTYSLAVMMSGSAQGSPAIFSALQEDQTSSSAAPEEAKAKVAREDKVLGRHEDMFPLGRQFGQAAMDGQMLNLSRSPV